MQERHSVLDAGSPLFLTVPFLIFSFIVPTHSLRKNGIMYSYQDSIRDASL